MATYRILQRKYLLKLLCLRHKSAVSLNRSTLTTFTSNSSQRKTGLSSLCHNKLSASNSSTYLTHIRSKSNRHNLNINCCGCQVIRSLSTNTPTDKPESTYDETEVNKFGRLSQHWWNEQGEFAALHSLNTLRVPLIRDALLEASPSPGNHSLTKPLTGFRIVDVGCGGGILSEPLARLGAQVLGLDASPENVSAAETHAQHDPGLTGRLSYRACLVEELAAEQGPVFDAVVASEVIEHVADADVFVRACCDLLKPGGSVFFTTLNRTRLAYVLAIVAAERVLKIVPAGAHDWNKFITPEELASMLHHSGADVQLVHGMRINPVNLRWSWSSNVSINYATHAIKR